MPNALDKLAEQQTAAELTDAGNGQRLVERHGRDVRFVPEWGWMVWTGKRWEADDLAARELALETARDIHVEAAAAGGTGAQKAIGAWARKSQQAQRLQAMLWCAEPALKARPQDFDVQTMLLPVANGTLDLRTGKLHAHRREHMATRLAPVCYYPDAECPAWLRFLQRVVPDAEVRGFLQRLVGYSLTGSTGEQVLAFLYGNGRNGKSVFLETIAVLLGDYHTPTRIETLSVTRGGGIPNDVAALAGARLVTVSETPEGSRMNESLVKDLTGGDTITARFLRREFFQFRPQFKLWIRGNHKPQIRGTDDGIWRRLLLVPFTVQIPVQEVDPTLTEGLRGELPGVLAWAMQGCLEWQEHGLQTPASVIAAVSEYRGEMDFLGEFIAECCIVSPEAKAPATPLYKAYRQWCEDNGHNPVSNTRFGTALSERGFLAAKTGTVSRLGIGLLDSGHMDSLDPCRSSRQSRAHNSCKPEMGSELSMCPRCDGNGCAWCMGART